jgi:hypothetical protein
MTDKDKVFSWGARDDEPVREHEGDMRSDTEQGHKVEKYQQKIAALEAHVAALLDEVKKWKEKAETGEAKSLQQQHHLDEVKKECMKLREDHGHIQEALKKAELELAWLETELNTAKGEK